MNWRGWLGAVACCGVAGLAHSVPVAETAFARCSAGVPAHDLQGREMAPAWWRKESVLVVFWSVDCPFCRRHNERLDAAYQALSAEGVRVVAVSTDDEVESVRAAVRRRGYTFPVLMDGQGDCQLRAQLTARKVVPMTCWLGKPLSQPRCIPGEMAEGDLRDMLRRSRAD